MAQTLNIPIDDLTQARLIALSEERACSPAQLASEALEHYMDLQSWHVQAIKDGIKAADEGRVVSDDALRNRWEKIIEGTYI